MMLQYVRLERENSDTNLKKQNKKKIVQFPIFFFSSWTLSTHLKVCLMVKLIQKQSWMDTCLF